MKKAKYRIIVETKSDGISLYVVQRKAPWYDFGHWSHYTVYGSMVEALRCVKLLADGIKTQFHYFDANGKPIESVTCTGDLNETTKPV
jgi:hypothetical protein